MLKINNTLKESIFRCFVSGEGIIVTLTIHVANSNPGAGLEETGV
jgi:hypothetical protein